eukprot:gene9217-1304_t
MEDDDKAQFALHLYYGEFISFDDIRRGTHKKMNIMKTKLHAETCNTINNKAINYKGKTLKKIIDTNQLNDEHKQNAIVKEKNKCSDCGKSFSHAPLFQNTKEKHDKILEFNYYCTVCHTYLKDKQVYENHKGTKKHMQTLENKIRKSKTRNVVIKEKTIFINVKA